MDTVEAFTDGSADDRGRGGWAVLLKWDRQEKLFSGAEAGTTNNRMELTAAVEVLARLKRPCRVVLHTDSQYLKRAFTEGWLDKWRTNGWKTSTKQPVKNQDLWQRLLELSAQHQLAWQWVKGHAGHAENEQVDTEAQRRRRSIERSR